MIDRGDLIIDWWKSNQGLLVGIDNVLPYVVLHQVPEPTDELINPLLLGANSLQRRIIDSSSPQVFREELAKLPEDYNTEALKQQKFVAQNWTPDLAQRQLILCDGRKLVYSRIILPVRLKNGASLLMTYSQQMTLH